MLFITFFSGCSPTESIMPPCSHFSLASSSSSAATSGTLSPSSSYHDAQHDHRLHDKNQQWLKAVPLQKHRDQYVLKSSSTSICLWSSSSWATSGLASWSTSSLNQWLLASPPAPPSPSPAVRSRYAPHHHFHYHHWCWSFQYWMKYDQYHQLPHGLHHHSLQLLYGF